jgi:hypothetical protein
MDTARLFAMGCSVVALAAGMTGAAVGSHQLILAGWVILIACVITLFIVIAIETWEER